MSGNLGLFQTTNTGTNWTTVTSPIASNVSGICGNGNSWWAVDQGATPTVYYSSNNGANWTSQYLPGGTALYYHMSRARTGTTIWAVRSDGSISRYGQAISGIINISSTVPDKYTLGQNYPNPFNPTTNIKFAIPKNGLVTLKIYDILGREVTTLVNEVKTAGSYLVDFNASTLSSGIYFYRLESNGFRETKKMMLIK
jgi:hypothetical protein